MTKLLVSAIKEVGNIEDGIASVLAEKPKDSTDIAIESIQRALLPLPVTKFCEDVDKNFTITADNLDATAERLEIAAADLRTKANDLRAASPDVRGHVERWITYEREANAKGKFYETIFSK